jgi:hypothetical protein
LEFWDTETRSTPDFLSLHVIVHARFPASLGSTNALRTEHLNQQDPKAPPTPYLKPQFPEIEGTSRSFQAWFPPCGLSLAPYNTFSVKFYCIFLEIITPTALLLLGCCLESSGFAQPGLGPQSFYLCLLKVGVITDVYH